MDDKKETQISEAHLTYEMSNHIIYSLQGYTDEKMLVEIAKILNDIRLILQTQKR